jgi:hypothetical protein
MENSRTWSTRANRVPKKEGHIVTEGKVPNVPTHVARLFAWFSGHVAVPSFNIVSGSREDVPT